MAKEVIKMRKLITSFILILSFAVTVLAVDPGVPDTIAYQQRVYVPFNQGNWSTAFVEVYFVTDDSVSDVTVPTAWHSSDNLIYADSIIWGDLMLQWDDYWSSINRDTSIIHILGFSDLGGADNPPLYTNLSRLTAFTIRLKISPNATPQIVTLDTTRDRRMGSANFGPFNGGNSFTPIIIPGSLYYGITTGVEQSEILPSEYLLAQNYPNPFNPITQISFDIPTAGNVNIEVYNLLGQKINTLVSGYKDVGHYTVTWNATDESGQPVPSGVYFYRLTTNNHSETKRMMLLK
jgi:hypothetical protein